MFPIVNFKKFSSYFFVGVLVFGISFVAIKVYESNRDKLDGGFGGFGDPFLSATNDVSYLCQMESHLQDKGEKVLHSMASKDASLDVSIELDTAQTTVNTYNPGQGTLAVLTSEQTQKEVKSASYTLTGTWTDTSDARPRFKKIRCLVTLPSTANPDQDILYRRLACALGLDLARGDTLQIIKL